MSLQDAFYLVGIVTMSLLTILIIGLIAVMVQVRFKIVELVGVVDKRIAEVKNLVSHPGKIVSAVGGAVVETAVDQIAKMGNGDKKRKKNQ